MAERLEPRTLLTGIFMHAPIVEVNGIGYFPGRLDTGDFELWRTNGTAAGTFLVKDVGVASVTDNVSMPGDLANVNGTLFFRGDDGSAGQELWKSDGTVAGTVLVTDIRLGNGGSDPRDFVNVSGTLFFTADDGVNGPELWRSDGTAAGTVLVKDIRPGGDGSLQYPSFPATVNGRLYFNANDGIHGSKLWKSDGTAEGTLLVSANASTPFYMTDVNGKLFFRATDASVGEELWTSDGTQAGTLPVKDLRPGSASSFPGELTNGNGTLYFHANDGVTGYELWKSDGTPAGTVLVKDIAPETNSSAASWLTEVNGTLFFTAGTSIRELWKTDGTELGTVLVKDAGALGNYAADLTNVNGTLFFQGLGGNGFQLWKSDGTSDGTVQIKDTARSGNHLRYLTNLNGTLFFQTDDGEGYALWKSDGTAAGTMIVGHSQSPSSNTGPTAVADALSVGEDGVLEVPAPGVLVNDTDADAGDTKAVVAVNGQAANVDTLILLVSGARVRIQADGSFRYDPNGQFESLAAGQTAVDSLIYTMADRQGVTSSATASITIQGVNDSPVVSLSGSLTIAEGSQVLLGGSFIDLDEGDSWTATVDYGDQTGQQPLVLQADKTFQLSHVYADNGSYTVSVIVRDAGSSTGLGAAQIDVVNVAPQGLTFSGPALGKARQSLAFIGQFTDPGRADVFSATIDWGDRTSGAGTITKTDAGWRINAVHIYTAGGLYHVMLKVSDDDGGTATQITSVLVVGAGLDHGTLNIVGTDQRDNLQLSLSRNYLLLTGTLGNAQANLSFTYPGIQRIVVKLGGGNDTLRVNAKVRAALFVDGGTGNDTIAAGGGPSIIVGGAGNDTLSGGNARDVLIGGLGNDQLAGGGGSDLLISGTTNYDLNQSALAAILAEWSRNRPLAARSANLRSGSGPLLSGSGVMLVRNQTMFDDNGVDTLMGGGDTNWFLFDAKKDRLKDKGRGDLLN